MLDIMLVSGTILLIHVAFPALGFCPEFHDVAPFVQLNISCLGEDRHMLFSFTQKTIWCLWELKLWILKSLSISCARCCLFLLNFSVFLFSTTQTGPSGGTPLQEPYSWKAERDSLGVLVRPLWTDPSCHKTLLRMWGTFIFQQGMKKRKRTVDAAELTGQKCLKKKAQPTTVNR